jgi:hypothetical protein
VSTERADEPDSFNVARVGSQIWFRLYMGPWVRLNYGRESDTANWAELRQRGAIPLGPAPGGKTREEFAVRVDEVHPRRYEDKGDLMTHLGEEKSRHCREIWPGWTPMVRTVTSWPDGSIYTGPWREAPDA